MMKDTKKRLQTNIRLNEQEAEALDRLCKLSGKPTSYVLKSVLHSSDELSESISRMNTELVYESLYAVAEDLSKMEKETGIDTTNTRGRIREICTLLS